MADTRKVGFDKEKEAAKFLKENGYKILETNFTTIFGEIDIIAKHKDCLVFVEVKYRSNLSGGTPQEAVTKTKQQKIIKSAILYLKQKNFKDSFRFDIVAITGDKFEIIESAFSSDKYFI
ncbi:MAG: YraN family protein [Endomicrobia bacterium]|nr:YraN family protein [Endomicrobiia bacterium]